MKRASDPLDSTFTALAHPARRRMLDLLVTSPGCSVKWITSHFEFTRIAAMKHLGVLEDAGLVISEKKGRTRQLYFNSVPIQQIHDRWTSQYGAFWAERLTDVKTRVEGRKNQGERKSA
jgi:DNA-binding transcriptional ArsR family regulator